MDGPETHQLPKDIDWLKNSQKHWPNVMYEDLCDYLIHSKAYDGKEMKALRSMYGYNYVDNGWMGDIYSACASEVIYIKATISPSQPGVGRCDYSTWVSVLVNGTIVTGYCSCPAGKGRSCSHIAALIYTLCLSCQHGVSGESCTDKAVTWGKGASKVMSHEQLEDINFNRPNPMNVPTAKTKTTNKKLPKPKQFYSHQEMVDHAEKSSLKTIFQCKGTMLYKVLNAPASRVEEIVPLTHGNHESDFTERVTMPLECSSCQEIFNKYINIEPHIQEELCLKTDMQSSELWLDARKIRITASKVNSLPKTSRGDPNKVVKSLLYNRFKGCAATRHGQKFEPVACAWFEDVSGLKVNKCGFVVCPEEPYIGASPDGLIGADGLIEIKCPTRPLKDLIDSGSYDLVLVDGITILSPKGKNGYYCQVQMTLFVTKRLFCKFVVWTKDHAVIVNVNYNDQYVRSVLPRIRKFYFSHLLVRITDEIRYKRLKLTEEYRKLCKH